MVTDPASTSTTSSPSPAASGAPSIQLACAAGQPPAIIAGVNGTTPAPSPAPVPSPAASPAATTLGTSLADPNAKQDNWSGWNWRDKDDMGKHQHRYGGFGKDWHGEHGTLAASGANFSVSLKDGNGQVLQTTSMQINCQSISITLSGLADGQYSLAGSVTDTMSVELYSGASQPFTVTSGAIQGQVVLDMVRIASSDPNTIMVDFPKDLGGPGMAQCVGVMSQIAQGGSPTVPPNCQMAVNLTVNDGASDKPVASGTVKVFAVNHMKFGPAPQRAIGFIFGELSAESKNAQPLATQTIQNGAVSLGTLGFGLYHVKIEVPGYLPKHMMLPVLPGHTATRVVDVMAVPSTMAADQDKCKTQGHYYDSPRAKCEDGTKLVTPCDVSVLEAKISHSADLSATAKQGSSAFINENPGDFNGTNYTIQSCYTTRFGFAMMLQAVDPAASLQTIKVRVPN